MVDAQSFAESVCRGVEEEVEVSLREKHMLVAPAERV